MLENAGAIVYTPRERDWQRNEVIVDNDTHPQGCIYQEIKSRKGKWKTAPTPAFAQKRLVYRDGQNPFEEGTARFASTEKKPEKAFAQWIPHIPETGKYAVYVTYQTLPGSVSDAKYLVFHKGGVTEFLVNQQIGGGTWVYLGTFEFDKGTNDYGMVVLSNESRQKEWYAPMPFVLAEEWETYRAVEKPAACPVIWKGHAMPHNGRVFLIRFTVPAKVRMTIPMI